MAVGISSMGTSGETGTSPIWAHLIVDWKMAESDDRTTTPGRREPKKNRKNVQRRQ
jgi:hypothetical protein